MCEKQSGDEHRIEQLILGKSHAKRRDRLRLALLALRDWEAEAIAAALSSNRRTVQEWVYRYRYGGIEVLLKNRHRGRTPWLTSEQQAAFKQHMLDGHSASDGVCTRRGRDAVLIMDQAGWHKSKSLRLPANITILYLPPYSPELNPAERVWAYLRSHYLANRAYRDDDHLLEAGSAAYRQLTPELLQTLCRCDYITRGLEG